MKSLREISRPEGLDASTAIGLRNAAFLLLLVWLLVASAYKGAINPDSAITGIDFGIFYRAAQRLNDGLPLYQPHGELYVYSPLLAILLRPLAHLPLLSALKVWYFINAFGLILAGFFFSRAARLTLSDATALGLILLVSFRFWSTTFNFALGNINLVLLAVVAAVFWADSRDKTVYVALLIAGAALIKVWMLGMLVYLLLRRQWQALAICVGTFGAAMVLLFSTVGWNQWLAYLQASAACAKQINDVRPTQSIFGFAKLHLRANPFVQPLVNSAAAYDLFLLLCAAVLAAGFMTLWQNKAPMTLPERRLVLGLVIVSVLLLLPPFEDEYVVYCLPLLWTLLLPLKERQAAWVLPAALLVYLIFTRGWPMYTPIAPAYRHGLRSLLVSMDFFNLCLLWLITFFALRSHGAAKQATANQATEDRSGTVVFTA